TSSPWATGWTSSTPRARSSRSTCAPPRCAASTGCCGPCATARSSAWATTRGASRPRWSSSTSTRRRTTSWSPRSWRRSPANSPRTRSGARLCSPPPRRPASSTSTDTATSDGSRSRPPQASSGASSASCGPVSVPASPTPTSPSPCPDSSRPRRSDPARPTPRSRRFPVMTSPDPQPARLSFYEAVGGHETFARLVDRCYEGVADEPGRRPMCPEEDLAGAKHRLCTFLEQYWGGPKTYGAERGHPRLRMRHAVFPVSPSARDAWLRHMRTALDSLELAPLHEQTLWDYLDRAAQSRVHTVAGGAAPAAGQAVPGRLS